MRILALLFTLSLVLRLSALTQVPPSLNWDEVSHAYTAYSLLHTGRDQWGQALPLINFRAFGDYPAALNLYLTVPSIAIFGPTDFAARLPHALLGALIIPLVFIACYRLFKNRYLTLLVSILCVFDPWLFFTSRTVLQSNVAVLFLCLFLASYPRRLWLALFGLLAYHNTRIFLPLLFVGLSIFTRRHYLYTTLIVIISGLILLAPTSRARSIYVGLINPGIVSQLEQLRNTSTLPPPWPHLLYNRPVYFLTHAAANYLDYFSPQYLFLSGGTQYQFSLPNFGVLSPALFVFFYIGIGLLIFKPLPNKRLLLLWLFLAPIPAAITQDRFAVVRATTMLPLPQIIAGLGLVWFMKHRWFQIIFYSLFAIFAAIYMYNYFFIYPQVYSQSWQYGNRQLVAYVKSVYSSYDQIIITKRYGEPHEFVFWYWPMLKPDFTWDYHDYWYWVNSVDKLRFVNDWELPEAVAALPAGQYLIISSPDTPVAQSVQTVINFLDHSPAYIISTYVK